ncbi:hypothetical protein D3C76_1575240 [compost metagenome]
MIIPKEGIPPAGLLHSGLPLGKQLLQLGKIVWFQFPLLSVFIIDLKVMEVEGHGKLPFLRFGITDAVLQGS